jgi:hypothetical protein
MHLVYQGLLGQRHAYMASKSRVRGALWKALYIQDVIGFTVNLE